MKVGFFDSGLGGLTVLKEAIDNESLNEEIYYLGDNKNTPYGVKNEEDVRKFIEDNIEYLVKLGCNPIVIACNTATCLSIKYLREKYKDIIFIGTEPAVKVAADEKMNKKIIILATSITIKQEKLLTLIDNLNIKESVKLIAADKLVRFAESIDCDKRQDEIEQYLRDILKDVDLREYSHVVLGCTHFPLLYNNIHNVLNKMCPNCNIHIVDGNKGISKNLMNHINKIRKENNLETDVKRINIVITSENKAFESRVKQILGDEKIEFKYKLQ